uniref:TPX2_importin domain-containing protein n=1 Tax=Syphacia muris TaxID=451379 RepID=A0A0N5B181_9BILA
MRKRKFASPFVSPTKHLIPGEKFSPAPKLFKPLYSITNILNDRVCSLARRKLIFDNEGVKQKDDLETGAKKFFHMKFPTMDLPDFVKEKELLMARTKNEMPLKSIIGKKRVLKGTMEDYIAPSKPVSNCSKMVRALERKINMSPRKLVLKQRLQESAKIAAERYTPKTPHREKRNDSECGNGDALPNSSKKPILKNKRKSTSVRTLEDYFNKTQ